MSKYFFIDMNNQRQGPVDVSDFAKYEITKNTHVWKEGMNDWQTAGSIPELETAFMKIPPPPFKSTTSFMNQHPIIIQQKPNSYLWWSIFTLIISPIFGIVALVYSNGVDKKWDAGNYTGAQEYSRKAKEWCLVGVVFNIIVFLAYIYLDLEL